MTPRTGTPRTVAVDVTPLLSVRTGIGRSVEEMLRAVQAVDGAPRTVGYALGASARRCAAGIPAAERFAPFPTRALLAAWSRVDLPRLDRWLGPADVLHATNFVVPVTRIPTLVTIHDCSFLLQPETVDSVVATFGPVLQRALDRGAHVHTSTEQVAREVEQLLTPGLSAAGRLHVVPFGVPELRLDCARVPPEVAGWLAGRPYVLFLGRTEPRKDVPTLVRAFGLLADRLPELTLVVAGPGGHGHHLVEQARDALAPSVRDRVLLAGPVDEPGRVGLLQQAAALCYPSLYEGFGFPVLEAMTVGAPVVCSDLPVLTEVAGAWVLAAPVGDVESFADRLHTAVTDDALRERLVAGGRQRAAGYTWARTGRGLVDAYRSTAATAR